MEINVDLNRSWKTVEFEVQRQYLEFHLNNAKWQIGGLRRFARKVGLSPSTVSAWLARFNLVPQWDQLPGPKPGRR